MTRPRRSFTRRTRRTRPSRRASRRPVPSRPPRTGRIKTRRTSPGSRRPRRSRLRKRRRVPPARRPRQEERHWRCFFFSEGGVEPQRTERAAGFGAASVDEPTVSRRGKEKGARVSRGTTPPPGRAARYATFLRAPRALALARRARLPEARRDAQSARLFADAVRRRKQSAPSRDAPVPRTRWSGRLPASRLDAGFSRIAGDAAAFVENRAAIAVPDRPQTGMMRYTGSHDEFRGELEPAPVVPEKERVANLVKQFYGETAKRAAHRAERYELYLSTLRPVSARERELLNMDDVPVIPIESDFQDIAEKELDAAQALKLNARAKTRTERLASAAAARAYEEARAQSDEARTLAMRARLRSAREERAVAERKAAEIREAKAPREDERGGGAGEGS